MQYKNYEKQQQKRKKKLSEGCLELFNLNCQEIN